MARVIYKGPDSVVRIDGIRLDRGVERAVPDGLADEIEAGSSRLSGHEFEVTSRVFPVPDERIAHDHDTGPEEPSEEPPAERFAQSQFGRLIGGGTSVPNE